MSPREPAYAVEVIIRGIELDLPSLVHLLRPEYRVEVRETACGCNCEPEPAPPDADTVKRHDW